MSVLQRQPQQLSVENTVKLPDQIDNKLTTAFQIKFATDSQHHT